MTPLEVTANGAATISVVLAARNSVHTWWTGIIGCGLFIGVFAVARLYADATLQVFFIATSAAGWWLWRRGEGGGDIPILRTPSRLLAAMGLAGLVAAACYGAILHLYTDAYAPFVDSAVLALSVIAQLLLMRRRLESWYFWIAVDLIAVPLYCSRGLYLTAGLYAVYLINAAYGLWLWRSQVDRQVLAPAA